MNTTAINIRSDLYNSAVDYAQRHNTSIDSLVESCILALLVQNTKKPKKEYTKLAPVVERLGNYNVREFTQEELEDDPRLAYIMEKN